MKKNTTNFLMFCFLFFALQSNAQNLIKNGGFENGTSDWIVTKKTASRIQTANLVTTTTKKTEGSKSLKIEVQTSNVKFWDSNPKSKVIDSEIFDVAIAQEFNVTKGDAIKLNFDLDDSRGPTESSTSSRRLRIEFHEFVGGKWISYEFLGFSHVFDGFGPYEMRFIAHNTTKARIIFGFANARSRDGLRTIHLDNVKAEKYANYDIDNFRVDAQKRIDQYRKGDLKLIVKEKNGGLVKNATVAVKFDQHNFKWGLAQNADNVTNNTFKGNVRKYFNALANINDAKWEKMEGSKGNINYSKVKNTIKVCEDLDMKYKFHTLHWTRSQPSWADTEQEFYDRVTKVMTELKGRVADYDVQNEVWQANAAYGLYSKAVQAETFKLAKNTDPDAGRYFTQYSNIIGPMTFSIGALVKDLKDNHNAPITGVASQAHMDKAVDYGNLVVKYDYYNEYLPGMTHEVTEFDFEETRYENNSKNFTRANQVIETEMMMYATYASPNATGLYIWGPKDGNETFNGQTFRYKRFFGSDDLSNPNEAGKAWQKLVNETWVTNTDGSTQNNGFLSFNGYYGKYEVTVTIGNEVKKFNVWLTKNSKEIELQLDQAHNIITSIDAIETKEVEIFPNPAQNFVKIRNADFIKVYSIEGVLVFSKMNVTADETVVTSRMKKGVYFIQTNANQTLHKLIIE